LDDQSVFNVQLACDEACSNVMEHAYNGGDGLVRISCTLHLDSLEIQIHDTGKPFDPAVVQEPDLDAPLEEREAGGLGLFFMRSVMDEVRFEFDESGNRLTMVKRFEAPACEVAAASGV
jgi:serine/threonine-protein kinase RsbW